MEIKYASLNHINHFDSTIKSIDIEDSETLRNYTLKLFDEITTNPRKKKHLFVSNKTEVRNSLEDIIKNKKREEAITNIANRLLNKEIDAQEILDNKNMNVSIQKGSLFQAFIDVEGEKKIIVCKADHSQFLDENSLTLRSGLPWDKKIFKAALIHIDGSEIIEEVDILDPNHSKYWWREFLELVEKHTDQYNTEESMKHIDSRVFGKIKKNHPSDYLILRNSFVGYFRSQEIFDLENFIDSLFTNYTPVDDNLSIDKMVANIRQLPGSRGFDNAFLISKQHIKKRQVKIIKLTDSIDLKIKTYVKDFRQTIKSGTTEGGKMYVQIFTEDDRVYEMFKRRDLNDGR